MHQLIFGKQFFRQIKGFFRSIDCLINLLLAPTASIRFSAGKSYAYSIGSILSDLYVVDGLK